MAGELILNEVVVPTTPASTKDAVFAASSGATGAGGAPRLARVDSSGNVYFLTEQSIVAANADSSALTNAGAAVALFAGAWGTAAGTITLPIGSYWMDAMYAISNAGTTSHTFSVVMTAGTAVIGTGSSMHVITTLAQTGFTVSAAADVSTAWTATPGTALQISNTSTAADFIQARISGILRITTAGTIIPKLQPSAGTGGSIILKGGSYARFVPFGSGTAASLGNWS